MRENLFRTLGLVVLAVVGLAALTQLIPPITRGLAAEPPFNPAAAGQPLNITGITFVPNSSDTVFEPNAFGGVAVIGGDDRRMHAPLILPDGAQVTGLVFYYYDGATGSMRARLLRNRIQSYSILEMLVVDSPPGSSGYGSTLVSYSPLDADAVIDNRNYNYEIEVWWPVGSSDLRLMRVAVMYQ
jgi:hypothetical protein